MERTGFEQKMKARFAQAEVRPRAEVWQALEARMRKEKRRRRRFVFTIVLEALALACLGFAMLQPSPKALSQTSLQITNPNSITHNTPALPTQNQAAQIDSQTLVEKRKTTMPLAISKAKKGTRIQHAAPEQNPSQKVFQTEPKPTNVHRSESIKPKLAPTKQIETEIQTQTAIIPIELEEEVHQRNMLHKHTDTFRQPLQLLEPLMDSLRLPQPQMPDSLPPVVDAAEMRKLNRKLAHKKRWSIGAFVNVQRSYRRLDGLNIGNENLETTVLPSGGFASDDPLTPYNNSSAPSSAVQNYINQLEKPLILTTAGLNFQYDINQRIGIQSGIWMSQYGERIEYSIASFDNTLTPNVSFNDTTSTIIEEWLVPANDLQAAAPKQVDQVRINYLEIPLLVNVNFRKKRSVLTLSQGFSWSRITSQQLRLVDYQLQNFAQYTDLSSRPQPIRSNNISVIFRGLYEYRMSQAISFYTGPAFKYMITPVFEDNYQVEKHPYSIGLELGAKWYF